MGTVSLTAGKPVDILVEYTNTKPPEGPEADRSQRAATLFFSTRIDPSWLCRIPRNVLDLPADTVNIAATTALRDTLLKRERQAVRVINGSENMIWLTEAQLHRYSFSNSDLCRLCGTHPESHTAVDNDCPVALTLKDDWGRSQRTAYTRLQLNWIWRLLIPSTDPAAVTTAAEYCHIARRRSALWRIVWDARKANRPFPLFPGYRLPMLPGALIRWRNGVLAAFAPFLAPRARGHRVRRHDRFRGLLRGRDRA